MKPRDAVSEMQQPARRQERIQKIMATAGLGSRRSIEKRIESGAVRCNREVAGLGDTAGPGDLVTMDEKNWRVVEKPVRFRTLIYNKPEGEVTTRSDPEERPTVFHRLPALQNQRWIAVGRLDINTSGLLLLTTDGELANAMMHPSGGIDREYACRIHGEVTEDHIRNLLQGVELEDGKAQFSDIQAAGGEGSNQWFHVVIMEGRNREVRRLWQSQGLEVSRLKRVRYGAAFLPKHMHQGRWQEISQEDHQVLREDVGLGSATTVLTLDPVQSTAKPRARRSKLHRRK
jgi:23S rRNA pseudouridine2605 synthase